MFKYSSADLLAFPNSLPVPPQTKRLEKYLEFGSQILALVL
jgi:hypothetical protein